MLPMRWSIRYLAFLVLAAPSGASDAVALDGVAHVAFAVSDVAASRAFYQKLGFEQAFEFGDAQGTATSYMKINDRQYIELYRQDTAKQPVGLMHLCFDTSDIERLSAAYAERGLKPADNRKARAGNLLFNLRDPEGQLLEYTQYLAGSLHWNARGKFVSEQRLSDHMVRAEQPVKDLAAEKAFFTGKLGFEDRGGNGPVRLRLPGGSGEEIEIEATTAGWKPRITLAVEDVGRTAEELKKRGLAARMSGGAVSVSDPDGAVIEFTAR